MSDEIKRQLENIAKGEGNAAKFAASISTVRSGQIQLREFDSDDSISKSDRPYIRREPDEQFQHTDAEYPGVICEIAYSQNGEDLDRAAWDYILHSNGDIKAVVGFELCKGKSKEARVSLWRPRYAKGDQDSVETLDVETAQMKIFPARQVRTLMYRRGEGAKELWRGWMQTEIYAGL